MSAAELIDAARDRGLWLTTAESCTGGLIAGAITDVPGSSDVFGFGYVTYANAAKKALLGVTEEALVQYGAVSEEVARQMAEGALRGSGADLALSVTGIAGPGGSETKPEGRVCFGLATAEKTVTSTEEFGALGRKNVRFRAISHGLALLNRAILLD